MGCIKIKCQKTVCVEVKIVSTISFVFFNTVFMRDMWNWSQQIIENQDRLKLFEPKANLYFELQHLR